MATSTDECALTVGTRNRRTRSQGPGGTVCGGVDVPTKGKESPVVRAAVRLIRSHGCRGRCAGYQVRRVLFAL